MLNAAGFSESRSSFGGGAGEDQFTSMLNDEYAREIAARGGFGLSASIVQSILGKTDEKTGY
ncbi:rod-binding protein [Roseivivax sp. CAU 1753]